MAEYRIVYYDGKIVRFSYKDYTGINPLQCPNCDKPLTFVGCFFGYWNPLQHLFEKAGKDASIAAVLLRPG